MFYKKAIVKNIEYENKQIYTLELELEKPENPNPGQFYMLRYKDKGEKPFGISSLNPFKITIAKVGPFTNALSNIKSGEIVWLRGPYGKPFTLLNKGQKALLVAGGVGLAPLKFLAQVLIEKGVKVRAIVGSRTKDLVLKNQTCETIYCTDDGSFGKKGFVTIALEEELNNNAYDLVYICGPEIMMKFSADIVKKNNLKSELLLERFMKCGTGICGSCSIDGFLVCKDGPVFTYNFILNNMPSFGRSMDVH